VTGIAGIVLRSPETVSAASAHDRLVEGIRYRGPDGLIKWSDATAFLVHAHLATVPCPAHTLDANDGALKCVGDIRLDNRVEVAALCGISGPDLPTDVDLVLAAYSIFGFECCTHFVGDFAFAIWDSEASRLFCARDPFGVRPFYYRAEADSFAFASDEAALGAQIEDPGDDGFVAEYLAGIVRYGPETRHPGIRRLLGGHSLVWSAEDLAISRYWNLTPDDTSGTDLEARFKALFEQAVEDRLYGTDAVAAFLSGGMDSSSIAAVAAQSRQRAGAFPLDTFSFVYPEGSEMDESPYIDAVLQAGHYVGHKTLIKDHAPLGGIEAMIADQKGPIVAVGMTKSRQLYPVAAHSGAKVILDGHGGDEVVGYGSFRLMEMAQKGQWLRLCPLVHTHNKLFDDSLFAAMLDLYKSYGPKTRFARIIRKLGNRVVCARSPTRQRKRPVWETVLSAEFLARTELRQRYNRIAVPPADIMEDKTAFNLWPVLSQMMQSSFEVLDKASAVAGVEARYPFFDTRLVAFCVGLPATEKLRFGQTRSILRRALKRILPDQVRLRQTKTSFHPEVIAGLLTHHRDILQVIEHDPHNILTPYIDRDELHKLIDRLRYSQADFDGSEALFIWLLCNFYVWRSSAFAPKR